MSDCGGDYGDTGGDSYSGGYESYSSSSYNEPSSGYSGGGHDTSSYAEPEPSRDNNTNVSQSTPDKSEGYSSNIESNCSDSKNSETEESNTRSSRLDSIREFLREPYGGSKDPEPPSRDLQPPYEDSRESTVRSSEEPANGSDRLESRDYIRSLLRDPSNTCSNESPKCFQECRNENLESAPGPGCTEETTKILEGSNGSVVGADGQICADAGESIPLSLSPNLTEYFERDMDYDHYRNHHDYYHDHHHVHHYHQPRYSVRRYFNQTKDMFKQNRGQRPTAPTLGDLDPEITFGPDPKTMTCPYCQAEITTHVTISPSTRTHLLAGLLCLFLLWPCVPCVYASGCCTDHAHYCPKCRHRLGTYEDA